MPIYWWDCFIENQKLYRGRINGGKGAFSMLRTAKRYGIECMSEDLKKWNISQILNNPENWTDEKWVAAYLNIKPNTLRKQRSVGVNYVPYSKIGGSVRYNKLKVMEYAESKGRKPNDR